MLYTLASGSGSAAVSYHVAAAAQRQARGYWTPARMASAVTEGAGEILPQLAPLAPPGIPAAARFSGVPTTGTLFYTTGARGHFCTASVVDSATGNIVLTAAHCVYSAARGYARDLEYVPGYDNGREPYGAWTVTVITIARGWRASQDPGLDFAFLTVAPASGSTPVQARTGGLDLGTGLPEAEKDVEVIGYDDTSGEPVRCTVNTVASRGGEREFYCHGYRDGTSGAPWILHYDAANGTGTVIGVIGGYQGGGDYSWESYSAYFGSETASLLRQAEDVSGPAPAGEAPVVTRLTRAPALQRDVVPPAPPAR
jgi:V8-like Glu-specific endopeptidase